jgi:predicted metalloendopeptidase
MRTTTIILVALLVLSVIANAVLGYTSVSFFVKSNQQELTIAQQKQTLTDTQTTLASTITQYNAVVEELNQANSTNKALTKRVGQLEDEATRNVQTMNDYRDRMNKAEYFVKQTQCPIMLDERRVYSARRNEDVRSLIVNVHDQVYSSRSLSSQWITMWDNSKSAVLQVFSRNNVSTRFIVSWRFDDSSIQTIYDVGLGCVMYSSDRRGSW